MRGKRLILRQQVGRPGFTSASQSNAPCLAEELDSTFVCQPAGLQGVLRTIL